MPNCTMSVEMLYVLCFPQQTRAWHGTEGRTECCRTKVMWNVSRYEMCGWSLLPARSGPLSLFPRATAWLGSCPLFVGDCVFFSVPHLVLPSISIVWVFSWLCAELVFSKSLLSQPQNSNVSQRWWSAHRLLVGGKFNSLHALPSPWYFWLLCLIS